MSATLRSSLAVGAKLADGGQGKVFELTDDPQHVFKEYHDPDDPLFRPETLRLLVSERSDLRYAEAAVDEWAAWPESVVTDGPKTVGFLMRRVPHDFVLTLNGRQRLADLGYLAAEPKPIWGPVTLPTHDQRVAIAHDLAGAMDCLHQRNIVMGDLSFANVLWAGSPRPRIMLLDCDGMRREGREPVLPQMETLDWNDPLAAPKTAPTLDRDRYKLAAAILRVLTRSLDARPTSTTKLDPALFEQADTTRRVEDLLQRAGGPAGSRPSAKEWGSALSGRAFVPVRTPTAPRTINAPQPKPGLLLGGQTRQIRPVVPPGG